MDDMREKLIDLIVEADISLFGTDKSYAEVYADHLIENGVILPPCKVGDTVYDICTIFDESTLKSKTIIKPRIIDFVSSVAFLIESKGLVLSEKDFGKTVFLTKEEAQKVLEGRRKQDGRN